MCSFTAPYIYFQEKLYQEAIEVVGVDGPVKSEHLPKLKYTLMVIYETLRVFPVIQYMARLASDDIKLGKYVRVHIFIFNNQQLTGSN